MSSSFLWLTICNFFHERKKLYISLHSFLQRAQGAIKKTGISPPMYPFSVQMVHSRQSRAKRPFQPFFETENNVFRSPDGWLSQRSWVSDWRTPEKGSEPPQLVRPSLFPQPVNGLPIGGLFRFCYPTQTATFARTLRSWESPCGKGIKGRFGAFSGCFLLVFLRLKRPLTFPLTRHYSTSNPAILRFFLE